MKPMRAYLQQFRREETGSVVVEAMLILPALIWCFMAMFVFFDVYRTQSTNVKAAYVLGDIISRESEYITPNYLNSLFTLQGFLVDTGTSQKMRVTVAQFDQPNDRFTVIWSQVRGGAVALTTSTLAQYRNNMPLMSDDDTVIITETWVEYEPRYDVGLNHHQFREFVVTRPRFGSICWNSVENGNASTATC